MHSLVPPFIIDHYVAGEQHGEFEAIALFLDISGFTAMTEQLLEQDKAGAEVLAVIINQVFQPIIEAIDRCGGFVTGFAGDALTALFPNIEADEAILAAVAALRIQRILVEHQSHTTRFGDFTLSVRQGLSVGRVEWGIVGPGEQKSFYFRGPAIEGCTLAEKMADLGDVIVDESLQALLHAEKVAFRSHIGSFTQLEAVDSDLNLSALTSTECMSIPLKTATIFYRERLWQQEQQGEFRYVVPVFISFQDTADFATLDEFVGKILTLTGRFGGYAAAMEYGDKGGVVLVCFGAPITHEDDVGRALEFILTLRSELDTPIKWRAGITEGLVYAGYVGSNLRDAYTCLGSIVNLGARLMVQAKWGEILVSPPIALNLNFEFQYVDDVSYKGFAEPIPTYSLRGRRVEERLFLQRLVGRDLELRRLEEFSQPLFEGRSAGVAIIYGEAGIGKSHLAFALNRSLGTSVKWLTGQTDRVLRQAFDPFVYFLRRFFAQSPEASDSENKVQFEQRLSNLLSALGQLPNTIELQHELARTKPFLGALVGLRWDASLYEQLDAEGRYRNTLQAVSTLLQAESRRQPVVLTLEDGHWFDEPSREMLTFLTKQTADVPLLIIITSRYLDNGSLPDYILAPDTPTLNCELETLTPEALQALALNILGIAIDERLKRILLEKSRAVPFFAQQILFYLQENDLLVIGQTKEMTIASLPTETFEIPINLHNLLIARLDRLNRQLKRVVQTAAVLGREFEIRLLSGMLQREIMADVHDIEQEQIWSLLTELRYMFKHVLMRDAAYDMQLRAQLRHLHFLAAETSELLYSSRLPSYYRMLAYHYERAFYLGLDEARPKAIHYLTLSGQQAEDNHEPRTAIDFLNRALDLLSHTDVRTRYGLILTRAKVAGIMGDRPAQSDDLLNLVELSQMLGPREQAAVAQQQAGYFEVMGDYQQTIIYARQAINLARQANDKATEAAGYREWGVALWRQEEHAAAAERLETGYRLATEAGDVYVMSRCLIGLGLASVARNQDVAGQEYYERALAICRQHNDLRGQSAIFNNLGLVFYSRHDYQATRQTFEDSMALCLEIGERRGAGTSLHNLGEIASGQGDYAAARDYLARSMTICREVGERRIEKESLLNLGYIAYKQGRYDEALEYFDQALQIIRELQLRSPEGAALMLKGTATFAQGEFVKARGYLQQSYAIHEELAEAHRLVEVRAVLAAIAVEQGDLELAGQLGDQIWSYVEKDPRLGWAGRPLQTMHFAWQLYQALEQHERAEQMLQLATAVMSAYLDANAGSRLKEMYLAQPHHQSLWLAHHSSEYVDT